MFSRSQSIQLYQMQLRR